MSTPPLPPHVQDALEAVREFLTTLLSREVNLTAELDETAASPDGQLILAGNAASVACLAVTLDEGWVPVLSEAVLDQTLSADEADDLLQDVAAQTYRAFQAQAQSIGFSPPEIVFTVVDSVPALSEPLSTLTFSWSNEDVPLSGSVLFPTELLQAMPDPVPQHTEPTPTGVPEIVEVTRASLEDFGSEQLVAGDGASGNLEALSDVELEVTVELGRRRLPLSDVLRLTMGSIIELEKLVGQPLEIYANGRLIAEGEAVVIDEQFGVRVTSLASRRRQQKTLL